MRSLSEYIEYPYNTIDEAVESDWLKVYNYLLNGDRKGAFRSAAENLLPLLDDYISKKHREKYSNSDSIKDMNCTLIDYAKVGKDIFQKIYRRATGNDPWNKSKWANVNTH